MIASIRIHSLINSFTDKVLVSATSPIMSRFVSDIIANHRKIQQNWTEKQNKAKPLAFTQVVRFLEDDDRWR